MDKIIYEWEEFKCGIDVIYSKIIQSQFRPQYIVGLSRGGVIPATTLSYKLNIPVFYFDPKQDKLSDLKINLAKDKILFVDDINDTGFTLNSIRKKVITTLHPEITNEYDKIFSLDNIKFSVVFENLSSCIKTHFHSITIDKSKENVWVIFPWEI